jgi:stage II sporulation protein D
MTPAGDSIAVSGRGYGHGVGLCQDGAKHMAEKKQTYDRIIGFYYPGTLIMDIKNGRRPVRP